MLHKQTCVHLVIYNIVYMIVYVEHLRSVTVNLYASNKFLDPENPQFDINSALPLPSPLAE